MNTSAYDTVQQKFLELQAKHKEMEKEKMQAKLQEEEEYYRNYLNALNKSRYENNKIYVDEFEKYVPLFSKEAKKKALDAKTNFEVDVSDLQELAAEYRERFNADIPVTILDRNDNVLVVLPPYFRTYHKQSKAMATALNIFNNAHENDDNNPINIKRRKDASENLRRTIHMCTSLEEVQSSVDDFDQMISNFKKVMSTGKPMYELEKEGKTATAEGIKELTSPAQAVAVDDIAGFDDM